MSLDQIVELWPILLFAGSLVYGHLTARGKANAAQIEEMEREHTRQIAGAAAITADLKARIDVLEAAMPTHDDMQSLHGRVTEVGKQVSKVEGAIEAGNRIQNNILQVLLQERNP